MKVDLLIRGGRVIDPARSMDEIADVAIIGNKIVNYTARENIDAKQVLDATDCLVVPGLIDFHTHLFSDGTELGIIPDLAYLPMGVTSAVDAGSAGIANYNLFQKSIINNSKIRIKSFLNVCPVGLATTSYHESVNPKYYNEEKIIQLFETYPDVLLGLKIRLSKEIVDDLGIMPLEETIRIAEIIGCPVVVHTTNPPEEVALIAKLLRMGDVFCHVYQGKGNTIITSNDKVDPEIISARERGVIFDAANGKNHFSFKIANTAIKDNFLPDIISTDLTLGTLFKQPVFSLPYIMSKYLSMGVEIKEVISACTEVPARMMNMEGQIGTLASGAKADVAIFKIMNKKVVFRDFNNEKFIGDQLLIPQLTILNGAVMYRQIDFDV